MLCVLSVYLIYNFSHVYVQDRLTRCAQQCSDEFKDSVSGVGVEVAQIKAEQCLIKCCDTHSKLVPKAFANIRGSIRTCS